MTKKPYLLVILGTARKGNQSQKVSTYITSILKKNKKVTVKHIDVKDYIHGHTIPNWGEDAKRAEPWRKLAKKADAYIIVAPEYNHGYPGELKMLLDQDLKNYNGKPVGLVGVSAGIFGGARVVEQLVQVVRELGMIVCSYSLYFGNVQKIFEQKKADLDTQYKERIEKLLDEILRFKKK